MQKISPLNQVLSTPTHLRNFETGTGVNQSFSTLNVGHQLKAFPQLEPFFVEKCIFSTNEVLFNCLLHSRYQLQKVMHFYTVFHPGEKRVGGHALPTRDRHRLSVCVCDDGITQR
jgi:hypothetical protein